MDRARRSPLHHGPVDLAARNSALATAAPLDASVDLTDGCGDTPRWTEVFVWRGPGQPVGVDRAPVEGRGGWDR